MILVIDNYDSFTYNLVQYIGKVNPNIIVLRNDEINLELIKKLKITKIIISPGPGKPDDSNSNTCKKLIKEYNGILPILGICLGHQIIGQIYNYEIKHAPTIMHGKIDQIFHKNDIIFTNMSNPFCATRYHSLIIDSNSLTSINSKLQIIARTSDNTIMACKCKNTYGIQFHPESIMSREGNNIVINFLTLIN
uniref:Anthranilate synthase component 2 n=1 Tax=Cyanidium sp. THAL103 TaxID=3027999 RepID=A0A9Y1I438_9RHOD|nr:anthranilate synthase component 2 [Cyanidium sp. THAL103]